MPTEHFIDVNGLRSHGLTWDGGGDTTVLLLHGFLDHAWSWHFTAEALHGLSPDLHLVAFDWRGHGESDRVGAGGFYHFMDYVRDLDAAARALRRRRLYVVGHSMGGGVAGLWLGACRPDVIGATLIEAGGPRPGGPDDLVDRIAEWVEQTTPFDPARFERPMDDLDHAARRLRRLDERLTETQALFLAEKGTRVGADGKRRWRADPLNRVRSPTPLLPGVIEAFWRKIAVPVAWIDGADSVLRLPTDDPRLDAIPYLTRSVLPGAGHMVQHHQPERLAAEIARSIASPVD
jgi:pimeloyl-ACP methyl ester carboxylesterase